MFCHVISPISIRYPFSSLPACLTTAKQINHTIIYSTPNPAFAAAVTLLYVSPTIINSTHAPTYPLTSAFVPVCTLHINSHIALHSTGTVQVFPVPSIRKATPPCLSRTTPADHRRHTTHMVVRRRRKQALPFRSLNPIETSKIPRSLSKTRAEGQKPIFPKPPPERQWNFATIQVFLGPRFFPPALSIASEVKILTFDKNMV